MELPAKVNKAIVRALNQTAARQATAGQALSKSARKRRARKASMNSAPVALSKVLTVGNPSIMSSDGNLRIRHREYLGEVTGYASADPEYVHVSYYEINPGLRATFPWFYKMARGFESYTVNSFAMEYVPTCPTSTAGSIILAPDFDVSDFPPETIPQMQVMVGAVRGSAWSGLRMTPANHLFKKVVSERMIRSTDIEDVDYKLYDCCCVYVGTTGFAAGLNVGSLWIEYDITLRTPSPSTYPDYDNSQYFAPAAGVTKAAPFGTGLVNTEYTVDPVIDYASTTGIKFEKPGSYLLDFNFTGTGLNDTSPTFSFVDAATGTIKGASAIMQGDGTRAMFTTLVNIIRPAILNMVATAAWTTVTSTKIKAAPYPYSFSYSF